MIPTPPKLNELTSGTKLKAGLSQSTVYPDMDFETYSPAGFIWDEKNHKFNSPKGSNKKGLSAVGVVPYVEHPDAEVLCLAYDLKNGLGKKIWIPMQEPPLDLINHVVSGGTIEAWNASFEYWVWNKICVPKYKFPVLQPQQLRCAAAKSRAFGLPGGLSAAGEVLNISAKKDKEGKRLLNKFSIPRNPTTKDTRLRIFPLLDDPDTGLLHAYNLRDIEAESELSSLIPDLTDGELEFWKIDQIINYRGVQIDKESALSGIKIIEQAYEKYNSELRALTNGQVSASSEIAKTMGWLGNQGFFPESLDAGAVTELLKNPNLTPDVKRVLEIRELIGSAAVKKLYSMINQMSSVNRLHDLFIYHSARTGRAAGAGVQPQNLPNSGLDVFQCSSCSRHFEFSENDDCRWCGVKNGKKVEWNSAAVVDALETIKSQNLQCVEYMWGDAVATVSGCLRGLFISAPGHDLICSDYSAIEAVVLAALSGEKWRLDVFNTHGKIYEMSASKITGIPFEEFLLYKSTSGQHHPMRKKVGKVAELASGYQGWIGAWKQFGADEFFSDDEIKKSILGWRAASKNIVEMWGGQQRGWDSTPDYYGLEGMAILAVLNPGTKFSYRDISYVVHRDILYCELPSKRHIVYHKPRLTASDRRAGTRSLSFEGWNTNPKNGKIGWTRMYTYGGKLTENVVQAVARDILAHAIVNLEKANYPVVLHVHDEIVCEVPEDFGSVEEFEKIMSNLPSWAQDWPVKASGGWRGKRYGK